MHFNTKGTLKSNQTLKQAIIIVHWIGLNLITCQISSKINYF